MVAWESTHCTIERSFSSGIVCMLDYLLGYELVKRTACLLMIPSHFPIPSSASSWRNHPSRHNHVNILNAVPAKNTLDGDRR